MDKDRLEQTKHIGARVELLRQENGESKRKLSQLLGVTTPHMGALLADKYGWSDEKIIAVAEHYGVSEELLRYGRILDTDEKETMVFRNLNEYQLYAMSLVEEERKQVVREMLMIIYRLLFPR